MAICPYMARGFPGRGGFATANPYRWALVRIKWSGHRNPSGSIDDWPVQLATGASHPPGSRVPGPHPPIPESAGPTGFLISRRATIWLTAIALFVATMTWLALYEIKVIAEDNPPTQTEIAECKAELDPNSRVDPDVACPPTAHIVWAARHPLRNSIVVFVVLMILGYDTVILNRYLRTH